MHDVYQECIKKGQDGQPYILSYKTKKQQLTFFGAKHSADPDDMQWPHLQQLWGQFLASSNNKKWAFCEGSVRTWVKQMTKRQAIIDQADPGLICWLAAKNDIAISSPEPDEKAEVDYIVSQGFSYEQIIVYYFARQMLQWLRHDYAVSTDWHAYISKTLKRYKSMHGWGELDLNIDKVIGIYEHQTKLKFSITQRKDFYTLSDPYTNPVSSASSCYRDLSLYQAIDEKWQTGHDVFIVFGSGHAIVLEPALSNLVDPT